MEVLLDGVALVVGNEIVTRGELNAFVRRRANDLGVSRPEDLLKIQSRFLFDHYLLLLKLQAGQDMGFDPEIVRRGEQRMFAREVERMGGPVAASRNFAARGERPDQLQEYFRQQLYTTSWDQAQTGRSAGATGRISVDRNQRPGQNWSAYQLALASTDPAERAKIGALPPRVVLQQLVLPLDANGGEASTLELAQRLIDEVRGGADFTELVRLWGAASEDGLVKPETLAKVEERSRFYHRSAALSEFASTAAVGEFSDPMIGWERDVPAMWVYRMHQRIERTPAGDYLDAAVQKRLREQILRSLDDLRRRVALEGIADSVYVWPPSLRGTEGD